MPASRSLRSPALHPLAVALAAALAAPAALAQSDDANTVVVTGSMREQRVLAAPFAITSVDEQVLRQSGPMINLSEAMGRVPGLVVANRNNYAQDLQIASRGFGARATFGVRGIRLYTDGIPASMPDGQGQIGHMDLAGASRIEVLRGPFSVLYGNASGGVIAMYSAPARERRVEVGLDAGSFGLHQARVGVAAPLGGGFDLKASLSGMEIDGFRPQSAARRTLANMRLGWTGERDTVVVLANHQEQKADDPLGLQPTDFAADPYQTTAVALKDAFNTRKTIQQTQAGVNWRHRFDAGIVRESSLSVYSGTRSVTQFLAIPATTQYDPTVASTRWERHGGGVVDFDRAYDGMEGQLRLNSGDLDVVLGVALERLRDDRFGYENFLGDPAAPTARGVFGLLRRDERNLADTRDGYVQAEYALTPTLAVTGGVRTGRVDVQVRDRYTPPPERLGTGSNKDDSGALRFSYTNPVLGLRWKAAPSWTLHASVAGGFESPTLGELAYSLNNAGFNSKLKGQRSEQLELGSKYRGGTFDVDATLFLVNTYDELGAVFNSGGRTVFANVDDTRRYGAELSAAWRPSADWRAQLVLTWLHASYRNGFQTCTSAPCTTANQPVAAGNRIAGTQRALAWGELAWRPGMLPGEVAIELQGRAATAANDVNTVSAPGFGILNLRWSATWGLPGDAGELQTLLRVDNAADRAYVGSVIVNDGNQRFFEPGSPRSVLGSLRWVKRW